MKPINDLKIFSEREKAEIVGKLKEQFGIQEISGIILKRGAERLFFYQGSLSEKEIKELELNVPIERVGIYIGKLVHGEDKMRLSIEGSWLWREQIKKNVFELDKEQAEQWMMGHELNIKTGKRDFLIMKFNNDFLGCGKASAEKIGNFVPKSRRLREKGN